jgi:hypothetical protein
VAWFHQGVGESPVGSGSPRPPRRPFTRAVTVMARESSFENLQTTKAAAIGHAGARDGIRTRISAGFKAGVSAVGLRGRVRCCWHAHA